MVTSDDDDGWTEKDLKSIRRAFLLYMCQEMRKNGTNCLTPYDPISNKGIRGYLDSEELSKTFVANSDGSFKRQMRRVVQGIVNEGLLKPAAGIDVFETTDELARFCEKGITS